MKYLRKFNESKGNDIKEFVDNYLSYLLDEGFETIIDLEKDPDAISFSTDLHLLIPNNDLSDEGTYSAFGKIFYWDDIKDYFIPFMLMFIEEYSFSSLKILSKGGGSRTFRKGGGLENLLNDNFNLDEDEIYEVVITNIKKI
jgi:hypothetical protein